MKYGVIIGRFQPLHKGHVELFNKALESVDKLIIFIGSSLNGRSVKNPFNEYEIIKMINDAIGEDKIHCFAPLRDLIYDDDIWLEIIMEFIKNNIEKDDEVCFFGHKKDESSFYLDFFTNVIDYGLLGEHHSTDIRNEYFLNGNILPETIAVDFLENFKTTEEYKLLKKEYEFIRDYKKSFENVPYPVIFQTVDSIVFCKEHILLVERMADTGIGKLALPGGFLDYNETLYDGAVREVEEETGLKLKKEYLIGDKYFDNPNRSSRGRIITHCFVFSINSDILPVVKGAEGETEARWVHIDDLYDFPFHDDHFSIIFNLIGARREKDV